jgi:hypothetical protein
MAEKEITIREKYDIKDLKGHERCELCGAVELWVADVVDLDFRHHNYLCRSCYYDICVRRMEESKKQKHRLVEKENAWKNKVINLPIIGDKNDNKTT